MELEPNPNILRDSVKNKTEKQVIVGFGLETDDVQKHGKEKLEKSGADFLVLNTPVMPNAGFGFDQVPFAILEQGKSVPELTMRSKRELAAEIVNKVRQKLEDLGA